MRASLRRLGLLAMLALLGGCGGQQGPSSASLTGSPQAIAMMVPTEGNRAWGRITLEQMGDDVVFVADIYDLVPGSKHAWNVHEWGDVTSHDGSATGDQFIARGAKQRPAPRTDCFRRKYARRRWI